MVGWDEPQYTGTGFPSDYYINYHLYRLDLSRSWRCTLPAGHWRVIAAWALSMSQTPAGVPDMHGVMAMSGSENFPVASRLLGRKLRAHLIAIYGYARLVDELGDSADGDRLAALDWLEGELDAAFKGTATHPILIGLSETVRQCNLPRKPFIALIDANRMDQRVTRYVSWEQLAAYCELSANPVGEIVLGVFGEASPDRVGLERDLHRTAADRASAGCGRGPRQRQDLPASRGSRALWMRAPGPGGSVCR